MEVRIFMVMEPDNFFGCKDSMEGEKHNHNFNKLKELVLSNLSFQKRSEMDHKRQITAFVIGHFLVVDPDIGILDHVFKIEEDFLGFSIVKVK